MEQILTWVGREFHRVAAVGARRRCLQKFGRNEEVGGVVISRVIKGRGSWLDEIGRAVNKVAGQFVYKHQLALSTLRRGWVV